jgi:hypothetical protein
MGAAYCFRGLAILSLTASSQSTLKIWDFLQKGCPKRETAQGIEVEIPEAPA